jgi:hypothetical protein
MEKSGQIKNLAVLPTEIKPPDTDWKRGYIVSLMNFVMVTCWL